MAGIGVAVRRMTAWTVISMMAVWTACVRIALASSVGCAAALGAQAENIIETIISSAKR